MTVILLLWLYRLPYFALAKTLFFSCSLAVKSFRCSVIPGTKALLRSPGDCHPARLPSAPGRDGAAVTDARRSVPGMCSDRCGGVVSAEPIGDDEWAKVIKKRAEAAGLDPALFSGQV